MKYWYVRYTWVKQQSVLSPQQRPVGGEGWGVIEIHPFKWLKILKEEKSIIMTIHFYKDVDEEEYGFFKELMGGVKDGDQVLN